jgi:hypothetical protein
VIPALDEEDNPNGMDAPPVTASNVPKWKCHPPLNRAERHHADYDNWH